MLTLLAIPVAEGGDKPLPCGPDGGASPPEAGGGAVALVGGVEPALCGGCGAARDGVDGAGAGAGVDAVGVDG